MIASGALKIPPRIDALYVEQEVHADETPAFEAVLMADKPRWALIKEERELVASLSKAPDEAKDTRLAAVYEEVRNHERKNGPLPLLIYSLTYSLTCLCLIGCWRR